MGPYFIDFLQALKAAHWAAFFLAFLAASLTIHPFGDSGTVNLVGECPLSADFVAKGGDY
jgi:hypothetical protein